MVDFLFSQIMWILIVLSVALVATQVRSVTAFATERLIALYASIFTLFIGLFSCVYFNLSLAGFQFVLVFPTFLENNITLSFGLDGLFMIFLLRKSLKSLLKVVLNSTNIVVTQFFSSKVSI